LLPHVFLKGLLGSTLRLSPTFFFLRLSSHLILQQPLPVHLGLPLPLLFLHLLLPAVLVRQLALAFGDGDAEFLREDHAVLE
jgi:hypothetical protein